MNRPERVPGPAYAAMAEAQRIAFAPMVFQACRLLRTTGILEHIRGAGRAGMTLAEVVVKSGLPRYGVKVLLESGLGIGLFQLQDDRFALTLLGHVMAQDPMTRVNMDFVHDVCYAGLFDLEAAVRGGRPAGLAAHGQWNTVYEGLSALPSQVQKSWFAFDHFYSDRAFPAAMPIVFADPPRRLLDVGGNTGRWALQCAAFNPEVRITIADLAPQLEFARQIIREHHLEHRVSLFPCDLLDESQPLPEGHDAIWMSQFLDCFSEREILTLLRRAAQVMTPESTLYILELFWDRQPNEIAAFCLQQTSLYFTCIANGNSQMYHSTDLLRCIGECGLRVTAEHNQVGQYHTLLTCRKS